MKYTFFVQCMRVGMPSLALALLGLVFAWPHFEGWYDSMHEDIVNALAGAKIENKMSNPHLQAVDKEGRPFEIEAKNATQTSSDDTLNLEAPKGTLTLKEGDKISVRSDTGSFVKEQETLHLNGRVRLDSTKGFQFDTDKARVNLKEGKVEGSDPVSGFGPNGKVQAEEGFKVTEKGQKIEFMGRTKLVLHPAAKEPEKGASNEAKN